MHPKQIVPNISHLMQKDNFTPQSQTLSYFLVYPFLPVGKGANDLEQLDFMTPKLSEITTEPSVDIPQKSFTPPSAPYGLELQKY